MKTLLVMRHAKSSWKDAGMDDRDRPLNDRGKRAAPRMGQLLGEQRLYPDVVLSSTAKRARETAQLVSSHSGTSAEIQLLADFYLAAPETYVATLRQQPDSFQCVMVIGHNPGLEQLVGMLTGADEPFPTAALAVVELELASWSELHLNAAARLVRLWLPRELE